MSTMRNPRVRREAAESNELHAAETAEVHDQSLIATNTGVRLACTMAAMLSLFALFLCWAEKESRVIRRFAIQSVALCLMHLCGAALLGVISLLVGQVPYFGFLMRLMGWLIYIAVAVVALAMRIRLMERAWHGRRYELPLLERFCRKYYE